MNYFHCQKKAIMKYIIVREKIWTSFYKTYIFK